MKNASGKRSAPTGSIISGIAGLKDDSDNHQRHLHVDRLSARNRLKLADYQRSLTANCMLNCSPGPRPGAPLKSPMVSVTCPNPAAQ